MAILFKKSDFENTRHTIFIVNQTSGTDCTDTSLLKIIETKEKGIVIVAPSNSCNINHQVMVCFLKSAGSKIPTNLTFEGKNKEILFAGIGKVKLKEETLESELSEVEIEFSQYDKKIWEKIINVYEKKQSKLINFFNRTTLNEN